MTTIYTILWIVVIAFVFATAACLIVYQNLRKEQQVLHYRGEKYSEMIKFVSDKSVLEPIRYFCRKNETNGKVYVFATYSDYSRTILKVFDDEDISFNYRCASELIEMLES